MDGWTVAWMLGCLYDSLMIGCLLTVDYTGTVGGQGCGYSAMVERWLLCLAALVVVCVLRISTETRRIYTNPHKPVRGHVFVSSS